MSNKKEGFLEKLRKKLVGKEKYYVRGSGYVHIPQDRVNEIPKVIKEYHQVESKKRVPHFFARTI